MWPNKRLYGQWKVTHWKSVNARAFYQDSSSLDEFIGLESLSKMEFDERLALPSRMTNGLRYQASS
jgi:hypothetical protein